MGNNIIEYEPFSGNALWVWSTGCCKTDSVGETVAFRNTFTLKDVKNATLQVYVSADSDYVLYCNGNLVGRGPAKGDVRHQFYDTYDLSGLLVLGKNCIAALAVGFAGHHPNYLLGGPPENRITATNGFILDGEVKLADGSAVPVHSSAAWKAMFCPDISFSRIHGVPFAGPGEMRKMYDNPDIWMFASYDDSKWENALTLAPGVTPENVINSTLPYRLIPRRIPYLSEERCKFKKIFDYNIEKKAADLFLNRKPLEILPHTVVDLTLDAGEIVTAYPDIVIEGTCEVSLFYSETLFCKEERVRFTDLQHSPVSGPMVDIINSDSALACWQPFFWRAFRFIRIRVCSRNSKVKIKLNDYIFTSYPYKFSGTFKSDNTVLVQMWEIGKRTLRLCSHETFEDCPYYERLQYSADAQIAAQLAYILAGDTALVSQAIAQFRWSLNDEGLIYSSFPARAPVILPLWSLHWICLIYDYYMYTGDKNVIKENYNQILAVLNWFMDRRNKRGLLGKMPYWWVADWSPDWGWLGVPPGMETGESALPNFFLIYCLRKTAAFAKVIKKTHDFAYLQREAENMAIAADRRFWNDTDGVYSDIPSPKSSVSQLTNAWAVISGSSTPDKYIRIADALQKKTDICKASIFGKYFVFTALLKIGRKSQAFSLLEEWASLMDQGFSTWPEGTSVPRSECHVWSSLPNILIQQMVLGIRPLSPGYSNIEIDPYWDAFGKANAAIPLKNGILEIDLEKNNDKYCIFLKIPPKIKAKLFLPDGTIRNIKGIFNCKFPNK